MNEDITLQQALIDWFRDEAEPLPWRQARDPYTTWISEIMLQQTQVATVIPYFERFMARFPTLEALAAAEVDDVLKQWEGLGYYARARSLQKAARIIVEAHGGQFPRTVESLMALPGIGRYTAGAILSFGHGITAPLVDGNVMRVFCRLYDLPDVVTQPATQKMLWGRAEALLPEIDAPLWNEGLMELGRRICTKASPSCQICPVKRFCLAYASGTQGARPNKPSRGRTPHVDVTAAVIHDGAGRYLIAQRPLNRMLGGLWEFPGGKKEPGETLEACLAREIREELGLEIAVGELLVKIRHAYTHFRITLHVFEAEILSGEPQAIDCADWRWASIEEMSAYAFPVTDQKIIQLLSKEGRLL